MKTSFLELKSRNLLSKAGTVHAGEILNSGNVLKSLSKKDALNAIQGVAGARWCCDSCGSASWL